MRPAARASPPGRTTRSRYTPTLIVLAISGESRATVPFARPKKIYRHGGFEDSRVRSICVVDRATTTTARVMSAHGPETDMHEPTIVVARLEKQRKPMSGAKPSRRSDNRPILSKTFKLRI